MQLHLEPYYLETFSIPQMWLASAQILFLFRNFHSNVIGKSMVTYSTSLTIIIGFLYY